MVNKNQIVIFGAGKIGRSFIGQLFGCSGYQVVFIDVDQAIIARLNLKGSYRVVIKGEKEEEIIVPNVQAISALEKDKVIEAVSTAGILAVSVGKNVLERIIPVIAAGLVQRNTNNPGTPLDIILAENMRSAADFVKEQLMKNLPSGFPVETLVGLVETSIGKWNEKTFVVNHVIYNKGKKCVEGDETRVWALRHPDDPTRLKAGIIPPEIIKAFE